MKPRPRIRKTIKWGGAAVTVLLVAVWVGSLWSYAKWARSSTFSVEVNGGCLRLTRWQSPVDAGGRPGWYAGFNRFPMKVAPLWDRNEFVHTLLVPLWIPVCIAMAATVTAWRLDSLARRRAKLNLCPTCNYDRTGLARDTKCPECGAAPSSNLL